MRREALVALVAAPDHRRGAARLKPRAAAARARQRTRPAPLFADAPPPRPRLQRRFQVRPARHAFPVTPSSVGLTSLPWSSTAPRCSGPSLLSQRRCMWLSSAAFALDRRSRCPRRQTRRREGVPAPGRAAAFSGHLSPGAARAPARHESPPRRTSAPRRRPRRAPPPSPVPPSRATAPSTETPVCIVAVDAPYFNTLSYRLSPGKHPLARPPIMIDNDHYASHHPAQPGRARPTPRHGGAAGRRHADHAEARRRLSQPQHPTGLPRRAAAPGRLAGGRPG